MQAYEKGKEAIEKLFFCTTSGQVEEVFSELGITNTDEKLYFLNERMGIEEVMYAGGEPLSVEASFEYQLELFCEGSWRLLLV